MVSSAPLQLLDAGVHDAPPYPTLPKNQTYESYLADLAVRAPIIELHNLRNNIW